MTGTFFLIYVALRTPPFVLLLIRFTLPLLPLECGWCLAARRPLPKAMTARRRRRRPPRDLGLQRASSDTSSRLCCLIARPNSTASHPKKNSAEHSTMDERRRRRVRAFTKPATQHTHQKDNTRLDR